MTTTAATADWVRDERRKQNAVLLFVILACLLIAFFPRNERRLFTWPGEGAGILETIAAPFQTRLRDDGLSGLSSGRKKQPGRYEMVLPLSQPMTDDTFMIVNPWLGEPLDIVPEGFDFVLPDPVIPEITNKRTHLLEYKFRPTHVPPPQIFLAGVPEPATWALLIGGIGIVTWRMRVDRLRRRKRRGHMRWRRELVPVPLAAARPPAGR